MATMASRKRQKSPVFARAKLDPALRQHPKVTQSLIAAGARSMVEDEGMPQSAKLRFETLIATSRGSTLSDSKLQEVEGAFQDALEESQGLSIVTKHLYQELLGFLARSGQSEQIQARLKEMKLGGFPADQVTYGIIINALASSAFASLASSFFRQAEQEGIALTLPLCNAMLKASGSAGDLQAAEAFLEKIYGASLRPNIISFNNLLGACAVVGSLSEARKVLERMRQAAVAPDGFSYLWMIKAAGRQGGEVAERCLAEAKASGVELGCGMYNAVLRAYLAETPERPEEVKRLFGEMQELQVSPDAMSYLALANAYAMQNDVQQAEDLIFQGRRLGGRGPEFYACLLFAYARKRGSRSIKAEKTFRELVAADIRPTSQMVRYLRMAMDTQQAEKLLADLGLDHLQDAEEKGRRPEIDPLYSSGLTEHFVSRQDSQGPSPRTLVTFLHCA